MNDSLLITPTQLDNFFFNAVFVCVHAAVLNSFDEIDDAQIVEFLREPLGDFSNTTKSLALA